MLDPQQLAWGLVLEIDRNDLNSPQYLIYGFIQKSFQSKIHTKNNED